MSIRGKLVLLVSGVAVVMVGITLLLVSRRLTGYFAAAARDDLGSAVDSLRQSLADSLEGYRIQGHVVANATLLKEALMNRSAELAFTYADSTRDTTQSEYVYVLDFKGLVLADVRGELPTGAELAIGPRADLKPGGARVGFLDLGGQLVAAAVVPSALGSDVLGYIVIGDRVTRRHLQGAQRLTRSDLTLVGPDSLPRASTRQEREAVEVARMWAARAAAGGGGHDLGEIVLGGEPCLASSEPLVGMGGGTLGSVVVTRSRADQLQAVRGFQRWLLGAGVALTVLAVAVGALAGYRTAGPIRALIESARRVARGERISPSDWGGSETSGAAARSKDEIQLLASTFGLMASAGASRQERLEKEVELARRIQDAILPRRFQVTGMELAALMRPATEVGGDYYDVFPTRDGCWIGIGDVVGHGLDAGLTMLMVQSMIAALVMRDESASPSQILAVVNDALHDNIRGRLGREDHVTLTLLRYRDTGSVVFAGAHEDILVVRAASGEVTSIATSGPWIGVQQGMGSYIEDRTIQLDPGDLVVLYTDGITEARDPAGNMFGVDRLRAELAGVCDRPVTDIRDRLMSAARGASTEQADDMTVLVARHLPGAGRRQAAG
jgi:sigma-B regulation protein RsbU (phosphoserine phosphatase)